MSFRITDLVVNGSISASGTLNAYSIQGNANVSGTGNASYHPSGIYSTSTNWLYGTMYLNSNSINDANNIYNYGWFRNYSTTGLYNQSYDNHFRASSSDTWEISTSSGSTVNFKFYTGGLSTYRGSIYTDGGSFGILNTSGQWAVRAYGGSETQIMFNGSWRGIAQSSGFRVNGNIYTDTDYGYGHVGVYSSTRYQGVFAMGDSYKLPADGSSTGSLYGLAWSHPNAGGVAGNLNTHGLLVMENGSFLAAISGSIRARDDMRAPIFYDSNNTSYYLDPSGSVSLNVAGNIHTQGGGFASNAWSSSSGNEAVRVFAPQGASASWDGGITGALRIRLPQRANNTMWSMKVRIYNYSTNQTAEYTMGNYSYDQGGYNASAHFIGASSAPIYNVRFGNQDGYDCVWIGETSTSWSYPVVSVMDFSGGFRAGNASTWDDGWNITYVTSFGTIATTIYPSIRLASVYFDNLYYNGNTNYGITSTNGYFDTVNTGSSGDPLELNYYRTGNVYIGPNGGDNTVRASSFYLYNSGGQIYAINGSYIGYSTWLQSSGTHGLYSPSSGSGTHWYPAASYTYGSWYMEGFRNGYIGILLYGTAGPTTIMYDSSGNGGVYRQGSDWHYYWSASNTCLGINGSTTSSTYALYVNGKGIYSVGDVVAYSDIRKKKDIVTIDNALDKVLDMRGVYYIRKDQEEKGRQTGVIAQEVETVLPEVVTYAKDTDEYGVAYGNMAGLFIEAFKEQQKLIQELRSEIEVLKSKI